MERAWKFDNHFELNGTGSDQWTGVTTYGSTQGSRTGGLELPEANAVLAQIGNTLDEKKQDELWRKVGEILYTQHKEVPLFWLPIEAMVDPKIVSDWIYPGSATGSWTHVENIKAAR
jgi:ABC-type transport system substrate-binding protein